MTEIRQSLVNCLKTFYRIEVDKLHLLPLGADTNASVYKVESSDRKTYFVKVKRGHPEDVYRNNLKNRDYDKEALQNFDSERATIAERQGASENRNSEEKPTPAETDSSDYFGISLVILELLQTAGIREIIFPIRTIRGDLTQKFSDFTLIVYPFVEGQDGFSRSLNQRQWIQLGKILRQIHDIKVPEKIQSRIRREDFSPKWREAVRSHYIQIEKIQINDEIGRKFAKFFKEHKSTIEQLVNRAEQFCQKVRDKPLKLVLCHSDIHGGNILLSDHDTFHIVDWDDPILAPKERDLMFIGGGVGNVWNHPHEEDLFYEGYGNVKVDQTILAYYRFERIVEDIAIYVKEILMSEESSKDREEMYRHFVDQFEPRGVVDLALKTHEKI